MLSQAEMKQFLGEVVAVEFTDEQEEFDEGADYNIELAYTDQLSSHPANDPRKFRFIAEATTVLTFVKLIAATVLAVKKAWDAFHTAPQAQRRQKLESEWTQSLVAAGIDEQKAASIAARFTADLEKRLETA